MFLLMQAKGAEKNDCFQGILTNLQYPGFCQDVREEKLLSTNN